MSFRGDRALAVSILAVASMALGGVVGAQEDYPTRPIRVVVGDGPGSGGDIVARMLAQKFGPAWTVVVDNRPGANGIIAAETVARSKPDGYTLLIGVVSMLAMNQTIYKKLPYSYLDNFTAISLITTNHFTFIVNPSVPVRSVTELVKLAKARPGELLYASSGVGNQNHLSNEMFAKAAGITLRHIPHKGTGPAQISLASGDVGMMITAASPMLPLIRSNKVRLLATAGTKRVRAFPDTPTLVELGYPNVVIVGGTGLVAPKGTPPAIIDRISQSIAREFASADVRAALSDDGRDVTPTTPAEYDAFLKGEITRWGDIIRSVGLENSQ
jgi:tripartite-type tricarboxylate transporter receptor subunit TctC